MLIAISTTSRTPAAALQITALAPEARDINQRLVDLLRKIGDRHGATPAQVALSWLLPRKKWIVPLFGARKLERFEENIGALSVHLADGDLRELNHSRATLPVHGNRYPEEHMRRVGL
jgi:aryl-alcohol dehydrogenase-like predicted oxidoreductase